MSWNFKVNTATIKTIKKIETISDFVGFAEKQMNANSLYFGHGTDNAYDEAVAMIEFVLNERNIAFNDRHNKLTKQNLSALLHLLNQRIETQKPLAYLTNQAFFAHLEFYVNEKVIVPRSPIAELILTGFNGIELLEKQNYQALDLCTGSGCIGLSMAYYLPCKVMLSDIDNDALTISQINLEQLQKIAAEANKKLDCEIIKSDLFQSIHSKFDLIVSNPPYVSQREYKNLNQEYFFEPKIALVAENNGLELVEIIIKKAANYLNDGGYLILEVGSAETELIKRYPYANFVWLEFENGGSSVLAITKQDLIKMS